MPLSEEEQKMLEEIERSFYDNDPSLSRNVGINGSAAKAKGPFVVGAAGIAGGLALVILGLSRHVAISYVGFLAMLAGSFALLGHLRTVAHRGLSALTHRIADNSTIVTQRRQATNRPTRRRTDQPDDGPDPRQ